MSMMPEPPSFRFSDVLRHTFEIIWRNGSPFLTVAVAIMVPQTFVQIAFPGDLSAFGHGLLNTLKQVVLYFDEAIFRASVEIALVYAVLQAVTGRFIDLRASIAWAKRRALPAFAVALLLELSISLPFELLLEFGVADIWGAWLIVSLCWLYATTIFTVALPAMMVERCGILGCLKRSASLTAGYRLQILAIWIATVIAISVIDFLVGELTAILSDSLIWVSSLFLVKLLDNSIFVLFGSVVSIVIYSKLRVVKDGPSAESVASIFD